MPLPVNDNDLQILTNIIEAKKKVLTFTLYGNAPKYTIGAIRNAELAKTMYPDFECWFYVHFETVPKEITEKLFKMDNVKLIYKTGDLTQNKPFMWRFEAIDDPEVSVMMARDVDTRIIRREVDAVDEWLQSGKTFHIMRDHPHHGAYIFGGMFGTKKINKVPSWKQLIDSFVQTSNYMYDVDFLTKYIYPNIVDDCIIHATFHKHEGGKCLPFPSPYDDYRFVGEYVYEDESRNAFNVNQIKQSVIDRKSIECYNLKMSNDIIINLIKKGEPFIITRCGIGSETMATYEYLKYGNANMNYAYPLGNNAGIYNVNNESLAIFCKMYGEAIANSAALATFNNGDNCVSAALISEHQKYFIEKYKMLPLYHVIIEPWWCCYHNIIPWSHQLFNKKILIVSPFIESMKKQLNNNYKMFKKVPIFLDGQEFVFYKAYQTSAGNNIHSNWKETFEIMCNDIKQLDFDFALLGCGGYGLPLCNYILKTLNKSAIYVGGGLQLLFGIMGRRWENATEFKKISEENGSQFIRPSNDEIMNNNARVEGGCYW